MTFWAIVPVKPLRRGKSRLAGILSPDERTDLNSRLLSHTLETLQGISEIEKVLVVSRDQSALSIAREYGALTVQEDGAPKLNIALVRATMVVKNFSTRGVLVIPADLPLLTREDVYALIEKAVDPPVVVIAPDHKREGTNGLLISPAGLIDYEFGKDSFEKHKCRAVAAGARLEICELPSLGLDMDLPEDLQLVSEKLSTFTTRDNY
ncbi:MAG: 2-phospho-L-lactate guanylyltransferase [Anaerolineales bacterium]|jgi:2-phospho-L-lactate guanylyltransferase